MKLSPMRFKNFIWPHNPRVYTITYERKMAEGKIPFGRHHLQSLGQTRRVFRGEGEFVGEGAYDTFKQLATVFYEETPGPLIHPVWTATSAWFVGLELEQEPRSDYVHYSFEFWEVVGSSTAALTARAVEKTEEEDEAQTGSGGASTEESGPASGSATLLPLPDKGKDTTFTPVILEEEELWHTVVKGESLWVIAKRYDTTVAALLKLNPSIRNPNLILIGQKVKVR